MAERGALKFFCGLKGAPKNFRDKYFLHQAPLTSVCERSLIVVLFGAFPECLLVPRDPVFSFFFFCSIPVDLINFGFVILCIMSFVYSPASVWATFVVPRLRPGLVCTSFILFLPFVNVFNKG